MDASALRWVLAIIGVVVIVGIYLYSIYHERLRRRGAASTLTREELEAAIIEDESLRKELSSINSMLDRELNSDEINDIKINPGLEAETRKTQAQQPVKELPACVQEINSKDLVAHVLMPDDGRLLTGEELLNAFVHTGFQLNDDGFFHLLEPQPAEFKLCNLTKTGSLKQVDQADFSTPGMVIYFDMSGCGQAQGCYELMLKKIDELVRILDVKVYSHDFQLLTIQHVSDIRAIIRGHS